MRCNLRRQCRNDARGRSVAGLACLASFFLFGLFASNGWSAEPEVLAEPELSAAEREFFEEQVRPILVRRCHECHSEASDEIASELLLDSRTGWGRGGARGPAIVPGDPAKSLLIQAVGYEDEELQMPPERKLPEREIKVLHQWIARGAPDPRIETVGAHVNRDEFDLKQRMESHWAWRPVQRPEVPDVNDAAWVRDPIDAFVLRRLDSKELTPAPETDRLSWYRRVAFDLTGLPPTRSELTAFLGDHRSDAYERVVDELVDRSSFGETWAQHWLDLVRFAETKGHEGDYPLPDAWRYRDYLIRAFNQDVAYDDLVREHVAGDLIQPPRIDPVSKTNQSIQGTGFWYLGEATHSPVDIRGEEADRVANQLDVFGKTFLGLTIACARCHDHKFDAISTADYYALAGVLQSSGFQRANIADPAAIVDAQQRLSQLNDSSTDLLWESYRDWTIHRLKHFDRQLLEAVDRIEKGLPEPIKDKQTDADTAPPDPVIQLARELLIAKQQVTHPLHCLAAIALPGNDDTQTEDFSKRVNDLLEAQRQHADQLNDARKSETVLTTRREGELNRIPTRAAYDARQHSIVDFTGDVDAREPERWLTSGIRFGAGPVQHGSLLLTGNPSKPIHMILPRRAAIDQHASARLTGLFRTKTFEVTGDTLWYRFRGKATVFLAVDSHRTVFGPLHAVVQQTINSPNKDAWFGHRVDDYLGHRVHVEFVPQSEFALYEVRFGEQKPTAEWQPNRHLVDSIKQQAPSRVADVAQAVVVAFQKSLGTVQGKSGMPPSSDSIALVNWLLTHDNLLPALADESSNSYRQATAAYMAARQQIESGIPEPVWAIAVLDGSDEDERIHLRGSHRRLADETTPRGLLTALGGPVNEANGSGRGILADRLVDESNPLTARVAVNRIWQHLFGDGLVASADNFGVLGTPPTHPELLDYLSAEFVADGWNVKRLIRRLVLSNTYRMSSQPSAEALALDPTNRLLHSSRVRRLTAEKIRDSILAVGGELKQHQYGASTPIHITEFMRHNRSPGGSGPMDGDARRSIYVEVRRNAPSHFFSAFDKPVAFTTVGKRATSNSAAQALILLNDPLVFDQASKWAARLVGEFDTTQPAVVEAFWQAFGRPPTERERQRVVAYLNQRLGSDPDQESRRQAWTEVCRTLYNIKEFIFLP
ncbi:MAG: PSD1 and planctomycete cytochrome C domain-containing protein [Pirellulaceae bacterium]|nr:PSD1 and planctomycete cytochrome C domain-containing protein [Pirellulaceae bacterium]